MGTTSLGRDLWKLRDLLKLEKKISMPDTFFASKVEGRVPKQMKISQGVMMRVCKGHKPFSHGPFVDFLTVGTLFTKSLHFLKSQIPVCFAAELRLYISKSIMSNVVLWVNRSTFRVQEIRMSIGLHHVRHSSDIFYQGGERLFPKVPCTFQCVILVLINSQVEASE